MGGTEIIVILIVALIFLGPEKLPDAAKSISKGIRELKRSTRDVQETIENDEHLGGAIRDIKSALRGEEAPRKPSASEPRAPSASDAAAAEATQDVLDQASFSFSPGEEPAPLGDFDHMTGLPLTRATSEPVAVAEAASASAGDAPAPSITLPLAAGEARPPEAPAADPDQEALAKLIKPAAGAVAKGSLKDGE